MYRWVSIVIGVVEINWVRNISATNLKFKNHTTKYRGCLVTLQHWDALTLSQITLRQSKIFSPKKNSRRSVTRKPPLKSHQNHCSRYLYLHKLYCTWLWQQKIFSKSSPILGHKNFSFSLEHTSGIFFKVAIFIMRIFQRAMDNYKWRKLPKSNYIALKLWSL